ncbi:MAG: hypothetical protein ACK5Y6_10560 [Pseudomonadota bacterium]
MNITINDRETPTLKRFILLSCLAFIVVSTSQAQTPTSAFIERPQTLNASEILPSNLVKGPHHTLDQKVTNDGYFNLYTIRSRFGVMTVEGLPLLETRINEMNALAELEQLSSSKVFSDAAYKAGKGIILAPVKVVEKTAKTLSDPQKISDTISAVPEGAEKLFNWAYRKSKSAANAIGDAIASTNESDSKKDKQASRTDSLEQALDQGTSLGLQYIGYTKRQREWFRKLQVNPYTSNSTLRDEVTRVAGIETAVGTAFRFVPGLGLLGELATINTWYERAEKLSLYEDPDTIAKKNQKELANLGVPPETITTFNQNKSYTPWTRRFISSSLSAIGPSVPGHTEFIKAASEARNEPSTLYFVAVAESLEKLHLKRPLAKIIASLYLPAAITRDGELYLPLPIDYLFWTSEVEGIFKEFKRRAEREGKFKQVTISIRGQTSENAKRALETLGARVQGSES